MTKRKKVNKILIQEAIKKEVLREGPLSSVVAGAKGIASGVAGAGRGMKANYHLGNVGSQMDQFSKKVDKAAELHLGKAEKQADKISRLSGWEQAGQTVKQQLDDLKGTIKGTVNQVKQSVARNTAGLAQGGSQQQQQMQQRPQQAPQQAQQQAAQAPTQQQQVAQTPLQQAQQQVAQRAQSPAQTQQQQQQAPQQTKQPLNKVIEPKSSSSSSKYSRTQSSPGGENQRAQQPKQQQKQQTTKGGDAQKQQKAPESGEAKGAQPSGIESFMSRFPDMTDQVEEIPPGQEEKSGGVSPELAQLVQRAKSGGRQQPPPVPQSAKPDYASQVSKISGYNEPEDVQEPAQQRNTGQVSPELAQLVQRAKGEEENVPIPLTQKKQKANQGSPDYASQVDLIGKGSGPMRQTPQQQAKAVSLPPEGPAQPQPQQAGPGSYAEFAKQQGFDKDFSEMNKKEKKKVAQLYRIKQGGATPREKQLGTGEGGMFTNYKQFMDFLGKQEKKPGSQKAATSKSKKSKSKKKSS